MSRIRMQVITDVWWQKFNTNFTKTTWLSCLVSATAVRQFCFPSLRLTPVLYQQRFQMITVSLSRQSHQLSKSHQQHSHNPLVESWMKTSLTIAGIHSADIMFWSTGVSLFEPFPSSAPWYLDLPFTITVSIAAMLLITSILSVIFCCLKARKLGEHLSSILI